MTKRVFGELELAILKLFQRHQKDHPTLTVRDIVEKLGGDDKYTTVMTVMNRMVDKGLLNRERSGQQYDYWIEKEKQAFAPSLLEKLKQKIFGGNPVTMASYLIESGDVSDADLAEMEQLIKKIRNTRNQL